EHSLLQRLWSGSAFPTLSRSDHRSSSRQWEYSTEPSRLLFERRSPSYRAELKKQFAFLRSIQRAAFRPSLALDGPPARVDPAERATDYRFPREEQRGRVRSPQG